MAELTSEDADSRSQLLESSTSLAQVVMEGATKLRTSNFFDSTKCRVPALRQRVKLTVNSKRSFTSTMQVQGFHGRAAKKCIKLHKSVLDHVSFVRQVDRKFILVSVKQADGSHKGRSSDLLLCIDQHAADERVRLEKLELELFGADGRSRNIDTHEHDPALILQVNASERAVMESSDTLLRSWGFDFEPCPSSEWISDVPGSTSSWHYVLRASPKIEKRAANADDFREFIQLLSTTHSYTTLSTLRPPVITRLLHSRACRSAIMFGDHLSVDQCKTLLDNLRQCNLPFQCAHGRPSVVPLAEFQDVKLTS
jgi:DNA mismatch repair protein MLH3